MGLYFPYFICPHCRRKYKNEEDTLNEALAKMTTQISEGYQCNKCKKTFSLESLFDQNEALEEDLIDEVLHPKEGAWANAAEAATTLGKIGRKEKTVGALWRAACFGAMNESGSLIIGEAIGALIEIGKRDGSVRIFISLKVLESTHPVYATIIAQILGGIGDPRDANILMAFLKSEDEGLRSTTIHSLRCLGEGICEFLLDGLKDESWRVRQGSCEILGKIEKNSAVEPIISCLGDKEEGVREEAVTALGGLGYLRAIEPLLTMLKDESKKVRKKASKSLTKLTKKRFFFDNMNVEKWEQWWGNNKEKLK